MKSPRLLCLLLLFSAWSASWGAEPAPSNIAATDIEAAPLLPSLPGQLTSALPGQMVKPLEGQLVGLLPGQFVRPLPGEIASALPGQVVRPLPGQIRKPKLPRAINLSKPVTVPAAAPVVVVLR